MRQNRASAHGRKFLLTLLRVLSYICARKIKHNKACRTLTGSMTESFLGTISEMLTSTQTWTNKWSELTTSMTGQTALLVVSEPCSGYSGPSQFAVYKDNIYGSYMLYPTQ
jgi:hypothetical protein